MPAAPSARTNSSHIAASWVPAFSGCAAMACRHAGAAPHSKTSCWRSRLRSQSFHSSVMHAVSAFADCLGTFKHLTAIRQNVLQLSSLRAAAAARQAIAPAPIVTTLGVSMKRSINAKTCMSAPAASKASAAIGLPSAAHSTAPKAWTAAMGPPSGLSIPWSACLSATAAGSTPTENVALKARTTTTPTALAPSGDPRVADSILIMISSRSIAAASARTRSIFSACRATCNFCELPRWR
mmetsp:Transcript_38633/g.92801  ORF Transcript_38633/g.92801 Transcript_38633/m.92801 type:complete len:239 (-) Transcript_38633:105-821(-)